MKFLTTMIATVGTGLMMAIDDFNGLQELHHLLSNRRRVLWSAVSAATAFLFLMSAIVTAVIEGSLQYEAQGFLLWSALFSASALFAVVAAVLGVTAVLCFPKPQAPIFSWAALDQKFHLSELLEQWTKQLQEASRNRAATPNAAAAKDTPAAPAERTEVPPADFHEATAFQDRRPNAPLSH